MALIPEIGQRWKYQDRDLIAVVEIISANKGLILQLCMKPGGVVYPFKQGGQFILSQFTTDANYAEVVQNNWSWECLPGQEAPK